MQKKKILDILGTIILFIGFSLAFLPHALHSRVALVANESHTEHVIQGIVLIIVGLGILIYNNDALKWNPFRKKKNQF